MLLFMRNAKSCFDRYAGCYARASSRFRRAAYLEMNGRFFGGRQIAASFYKEDKFDALDLEPQADEEKTQ